MNRESAGAPGGHLESERLKEQEDPAEQVKDYVQNTGSSLSSRVRERTGEAADQAAEAFGQGRESTAGALDRAALKLHTNAESVPGGSRATEVTHKIADGMEKTASYLRDHDAHDMGADVSNLMRRYPAQTMLGALAVGFLVGRAVRR